MPNPYNPNPYNEEQDRARQQPLYDQPGGPRQDASQEYHKGDGVFQIPWWVIVITFCFAAWPIGVAMMIINHLLRMGKISAPQSWSQNNRQTGQPYTVRPIYADPQKAEKMRRDAQRVVQRAEEAAHKAEKRVEIYQNADRAQAYDPEQTARQNERGRKDKGEGWSIALTVLGVIFSIAMVANLPEAVRQQEFRRQLDLRLLCPALAANRAHGTPRALCVRTGHAHSGHGLPVCRVEAAHRPPHAQKDQ